MPTILCKKTGQEYTISQQERDLLEKISPVLEGKKYLIPFSKYHPDVQHQQHLSWRNERNLYRTNCALSGKSVITNIHPSQDYTIYNFKDWRSDKFDPLAYGITFNPSKSFTEQFGAMFHHMPQMSLNIDPSLENCDYCNYGLDSKNSYMCTSVAWSENCYYSYLSLKCYYDVEGHGNTDCRYCYACRYAMNCYKCQYAVHSYDCRSCEYMLDCRDCEYCFGCVNLIHKKYCIFNVQYEKEKYLEMLSGLKKQTPDELLQKFIEFSRTLPRRASRGHHNEGSTGDLLFHTKHCINCFDMQSASDCINLRTGGIETSDIANSTLTGIVSQVYNSIGAARSHSSAFIISSDYLYQCFYCYYCKDCEYCFGCVRLAHKKYCIFNKQYTKQEYEKELAKILSKMTETGEWGEFFDPSMALFPYNDSDAYDRFPESPEQVRSWGGRFIPREQKSFTGEKYNIQPIEVYKNDPAQRQALLNATLICEVNGTAYKVIEQELDFYIKFDIPIPTKHHLQRYKERRNLRNLPRKLFPRKCDNCGVETLSVYDQHSKCKVYCEHCYNKEIYG